MTQSNAAPSGSVQFVQNQQTDDIIGSWILVGISHTFADGKTQHSFAAGDGVLILEANGRFCQSLMRADLPEIASGNRNVVTSDEARSIVQGSLTFFGTYNFNEPDWTLTLHIERSSFPNWNGTDQTRTITSLSANEMKITAPAATIGARGEQIWIRVAIL